MLRLTPEERSRLKNNTQRVFAVLLDGEWHSSIWFNENPEVGGLRWSARIRELREPRYGALTIEEEKDPKYGGKAGRYRLDLNSLTDEWRRRILTGDIEKAPVKETKTCPHCNGTGRVRRDDDDDVPDDAFADLIDFT
jgi:hypothetical protein